MSNLCVLHLLQMHRDLEQVLDQLASLLEELAKESPDQATRESSLYITEVLERHLDRLLRKKENVLFPALEAFLPRDLGPLAVLRAEQAELCSHFTCMRQAVRSLAEDKNQPLPWEDFQRAGRVTLQILRDQIYKEDRVLFPMVCRLLTPDQDAHLLQQMEKIDAAGV